VLLLFLSPLLRFWAVVLIEVFRAMNGKLFFKLLFATLLCVVAAKVSCATPAAAGDQAYPVSDYARMPDYSEAVLSPNGQHLAVLVPLNGRSNLTVIDLSNRTSKVLTNIKAFDVQNVRWIGSERLVFTLGENNTPTGPGIFEGGGLFAVRRDGSESIRIDQTIREARAAGETHLKRTRLLSEVPGSDHEILAIEYGRTRDGADVYRIDLSSGRRTLMTSTRPERVYRYVLDRQQVPRIALASVKDEPVTVVWYRATGDSPWKEIARFTSASGASEGQGTAFLPLAFETDNKTLLVASNEGRDTSAIRRYDVETRTLGEIVASHPRYDMGIDAAGDGVAGLLFDADRNVAGYSVDAERYQAVWAQPERALIQSAVDKALDGKVNQLQFTQSDRVLVTSYSDVQPETYWLYDHKAKTLEQVASSMSWMKSDHLVEVRPFVLKTRDGLQIPSYYLLPRAYQKGQKLPTVLHIHGGPHARADRWGALWQGGFGVAEAQLLASRGYAVVLPNFRITPGFGRRIYLAGRHSIGRQMSEDHEDAARWAIDEGFADPVRLCISGASYGGYAALWALSKTPDLFKCGVAGLSVSDLELQLTSTAGDTAYSAVGQDFWRSFLIGEDKSPGIAKEVSPVYRADRIKASLLFYAGAADVRTPIEQTNRMVSALQRAGQAPEVIIKADEGHGFGKLQNRVELWERMLLFLDKNIGRR
jgi:dipeptidyl aminopeptidase/acylaminoacyl peptidase